MLLRKPLQISSPHDIPTSGFIDIDSLALASVPSPSVSPPPPESPASFSKTNAFFSSPFSLRSSSPALPTAIPKRNGTLDVRTTPPRPSAPIRSRTAEFFSSGLSKPRKPQTEDHKRNFLNLDLQETFTTQQAIAGLPDTSDEPTPRPPAITIKVLPSPKPPQAPEPGTAEDAEVFFSEYASSASTCSDSGLSTLDSSSEIHSPNPLDEELAPGTIIRSLLPSSRDGAPSNPPSSQPNSQFYSHPRSPVSAVPLSPTTSTSSVLSNTSSSLSVSDTHHTSSFSTSVPATLRLTQPLGQGTFSSVWLAQDLSPTPLLLKSKRSLRDLRRKEAASSSSNDAETGRLKSSHPSSNLMRKLRGGVTGTRPGGGSGSGFVTPVSNQQQQDGGRSWKDENVLGGVGSVQRLERMASGGSSVSVHLDEGDGDGPSPAASASENGLTVGSWSGGSTSLSRASSVSWKSASSEEGGTSKAQGQLKRTRSSVSRDVAVKLTARGIIESSGGKGTAAEQRERDRTRVSFVREVEVLKHISHPNITPLLSHLTTRSHHVLVLPYLPGGDLLSLVNGAAWCSLSETIIQRIFTELCKAVGWMHSVGLVHRDIKLENIILTTVLGTHQPNIPTSPHPLIQLTDFGLSRFIDPAKPLSTTRCGSEAYAAPELVISGGRRGVASSHVLQGDATGGSESGYDARETDAWACGVVLYGLVARQLPFGEGPGEAAGVGIAGESRPGRSGTAGERRAWLMKIATADWRWPQHNAASNGLQVDDELRGTRLVESIGARRVVQRLLIRDPSNRGRISDLWDDEWMKGTLHSPNLPVTPAMDRNDSGAETIMPNPVRLVCDGEEVHLLDDEDDEDLDEHIHQGGWLVDKDGIDNIARQEVQ